jgi:hypothetical protein
LDIYGHDKTARVRLKFLTKNSGFRVDDRVYFQFVSATQLGVVARVVADFCRVNCKKSNEINDVFSLA